MLDVNGLFVDIKGYFPYRWQGPGVRSVKIVRGCAGSQFASWLILLGREYRSHILYPGVALDRYYGVSCISVVFMTTEVSLYVAERRVFIVFLRVRYILLFVIFNFRQ